METQITFREYQKSDHDALSAIIRETWQYDKFASPKTALKMAKAFLDSCLADQTFTNVAVLGDTPVRIIMGKNVQTHKCPLPLRFKQLGSVMSLLMTKEGRSTAKIFSNVNKIDNELLNRCPQKYQGEIAFFAISAAQRGKGLGKKLFQSAVDYMKSENIHNFYLFTDTSCNYKFYEHQGMTRRHQKEHTFSAQEQLGKMTFFIYDFQC